jgi:hypothetical protein
MGPIGNMHVNDDTPVGFGEHGYNRANEEPNVNYYNDVSKDHGEENRNDRGCNNNSNNRGEGGASSTMVSGNNDVAYIGYGDGGPSNAPQEEPTEEGSNQGVELQDNPPPIERNVNSQVPNAQERVPSIGRILFGQCRLSPPMSNRPPVHCRSIVEHAILGTSMNRNTNVGPPLGSGNPPA